MNPFSVSIEGFWCLFSRRFNGFWFPFIGFRSIPMNTETMEMELEHWNTPEAELPPRVKKMSVFSIEWCGIMIHLLREESEE